MASAGLVPSGAHLSLVDPPPPPPELDPREPAAPRRGRQTPQKARTPTGSRATSPSRPHNPRSASSDALTPIQSPIPRTLSPNSASHSPGPIQPIPYPAAAAVGHHISRSNSPSNSINSSSSAIFERDIEAIPLASLQLNPAPSQTLNHKSSRLMHGSALEQTVPAVLDDAVEALQGAYTSRGMNQLEIEAPTQGVGMARQGSASLANIGSRKVSSASPGAVSRSTSPASVGSGGSPGISPAQSPPILGQLSTQNPGFAAAVASGAGMSPSSPTNAPGTSPTSGGLPRPPMAGRTSTGPQVPGGWSSGWKSAEEAHQPSPLAVPPADISPIEEASPAALTPPAAIPSHLSPSKDKRRISFISYNDLLLSVPTTVTNLGEITSGALSPEHLPGTVSPSMSTRSPVMSSGFAASPSAGAGAGAAASPISPEGGSGHTLAGAHKPSWDAGSPGRGGLGFEGEWHREGLGKGLEQRLEDLVQHG